MIVGQGHDYDGEPTYVRVSGGCQGGGYGTVVMTDTLTRLSSVVTGTGGYGGDNSGTCSVLDRRDTSGCGTRWTTHTWGDTKMTTVHTF